LLAPGFFPDWHVGVRVAPSNRLVAFITGIPAKIKVQQSKVIKTAEINFLCVHKKLRSKRLAPVLIKEVTRRVNLQSTWQAVYTAGVVLPRPIAECRYWHRSLNPKKLIEVGFSHLAPRMTLARTIKLYQLPTEHKLAGFRKMEKKDVPAVYRIITEYLAKFKLHPVFTKEEIAHWLLPRDDIVFSLVRVDRENKATDLCSFYRLPSSILGHEKYNLLNAAYSFWNVANTCSWEQLMTEALIYARHSCDLDVFNALDIMDNEDFLKALKFGYGDGYLQYYLFNWRCQRLTAQEVGLVLL